MLPQYKFLKERWQDYELSNEKSSTYFVARKMSDTYQNMRILTSGREFEDQWDRVYVAVIKSKYKNVRNNVGNDVHETYIREYHARVDCIICYII